MAPESRLLDTNKKDGKKVRLTKGNLRANETKHLRHTTQQKLILVLPSQTRYACTIQLDGYLQLQQTISVVDGHLMQQPIRYRTFQANTLALHVCNSTTVKVSKAVQIYLEAHYSWLHIYIYIYIYIYISV